MEYAELVEKIGYLDKSVDPTAILNDEDKVVIECDPEIRDALVDLVTKVREDLPKQEEDLFTRNQIALVTERSMNDWRIIPSSHIQGLVW